MLKPRNKPKALTTAMHAAQHAAMGAVTVLLTAGTGAASANTATLQAAITLAAGPVRCDQAGVFYLNDTLTILDGARLSLSNATKVRQAPGINKSMLQTQAWVDYQAGPAAITLTWSSGVEVSVTWTGHGLAAGQGAWISGVTPTAFIGVFRVKSVTDANNFKIDLFDVPASAPSGSAVAVRATQNFVIEGGDWDYNTAANGAAVNTNTQAIKIYGALDGLVRNVTCRNAMKYTFCAAATNNVRFENLVVPWTYSDGFKLYGPAYETHLDGLAGTCSDDAASIQGKEQSGFTQYQPALGGDIRKCSIRNNAADSLVASCAVVYLSDNEQTDDVVFDGITGRALAPGSAFRLTRGSYATGKFGRITVRNCSGAGLYGLNLQACNGDYFIAEDYHANPLSLSNYNPVVTSSTCTIRHLMMVRPYFAAPGFPSSGALLGVALTGTHDNVVIDAPMQTNNGAGNLRPVSLFTGANVKNLEICNGRSSADNVVNVQASLGTVPNIKLIGGEYSGAAGVSLSNSCNVYLAGGVRFNNASNGIVRFNATATVNLYSDGTTQLAAGSWLATPAGTPTLNVKGWDVALDIGATGVAKNAGGYCYNTGTGRGTIAQNRLVTCNGTNWVQVDTPANVF